MPQTTLATATQEVALRHGIDAESGKKITRLVKDSKLKVQASLQGDKVRVEIDRIGILRNVVQSEAHAGS